MIVICSGGKSTLKVSWSETHCFVAVANLPSYKVVYFPVILRYINVDHDEFTNCSGGKWRS